MSIDIIEAIHKWCPQIVQDFYPSPLIANSFELQSWIHATSPPSIPLNADVIYRWSFIRQRRKLIKGSRSVDPSAVNPDTKCEHCVSSSIDHAARSPLALHRWQRGRVGREGSWYWQWGRKITVQCQSSSIITKGTADGSNRLFLPLYFVGVWIYQDELIFWGLSVLIYRFWLSNLMLCPFLAPTLYFLPGMNALHFPLHIIYLSRNT